MYKNILNTLSCFPVSFRIFIYLVEAILQPFSFMCLTLLVLPFFPSSLFTSWSVFLQNTGDIQAFLKAKMLLSWAELFQQPRYLLVSNVHKWLTRRNLQMIAVKYVSLELQLKAVKQIPHWIFQVSNLTKFMSGGTCDLSILFPFNTPKSEALDSS